jgi:hypothetical protein
MSTPARPYSRPAARARCRQRRVQAPHHRRSRTQPAASRTSAATAGHGRHACAGASTTACRRCEPLADRRISDQLGRCDTQVFLNRGESMICRRFESGRQDLNLRPPGPQPERFG